MKDNKKDLRMICLVPYNLSPIQQGIQAAHAIVEYSKIVIQGADAPKSYNTTEKELDDYWEWVEHHKTIIVLNGGTSGKEGAMQQYLKDLKKLNVVYSKFYEPDANDMLTGIAFIVDYKKDHHIVGYLKQMRLA